MGLCKPATKRLLSLGLFLFTFWVPLTSFGNDCDQRLIGFYRAEKMDLSFDTFLDYDQALQDHFNKDDTDFFNLAAAYHDAPGHKSLLLKNLLHQAAMLLKKRGVEFTLSKLEWLDGLERVVIQPVKNGNYLNQKAVELESQKVILAYRPDLNAAAHVDVLYPKSYAKGTPPTKILSIPMHSILFPNESNPLLEHEFTHIAKIAELEAGHAPLYGGGIEPKKAGSTLRRYRQILSGFDYLKGGFDFDEPLAFKNQVLKTEADLTRLNHESDSTLRIAAKSVRLESLEMMLQISGWMKIHFDQFRFDHLENLSYSNDLLGVRYYVYADDHFLHYFPLPANIRRSEKHFLNQIDQLKQYSHDMFNWAKERLEQDPDAKKIEGIQATIKALSR